VQLGVVRDPATLGHRIQQEKWPKKDHYHGLTNQQNLLELQLTEIDEFEQILAKLTPKKMHCPLCVRGETAFGCSVYKVPLYKTSKEKSHKNDNASQSGTSMLTS
jgi:hypothetical protein